MTRTRIALAVASALIATPALAQTGATPDLLFQAPGATQKPAAPSNISIGIVSFDAVAQKSQLGQATIKQLQAFQSKKATELQAIQTKLQGLRTQQQSQTAVLNDAALATMNRDIGKLSRDLEFAQQEAEVEMNDLRDQLMAVLQRRVAAMVATVAKEKGLLLVVQAESAVYIDATVDISDEIAKRLDAQKSGQ